MRVHTILLIPIYTSIVYYGDHACVLRVRYFGFQDTQNPYLESRTQTDSLENSSIVIV
jgi:hypothetical protein